MIVGTHGTGDSRYGPFPLGSGMHEGTSVVPALAEPWVPPPGGLHFASMNESHPHPRPLSWVFDRTGLSPENPSSVLDTSSMCEVHDPERLDWNVASETTY